MEVIGDLHAPATVALGEEPPVLIGSETEWTMNAFGEEKMLCLSRMKPGRARNPDTVLRKLPKFLICSLLTRRVVPEYVREGIALHATVHICILLRNLPPVAVNML